MWKKRVAAIVLLIQSTRALDASGLPTCGNTCLTTSLNQETLCSKSDVTCLCGDGGWGYDFGYCLGLSCDAVDQQASLNWLANLCLGSSSGGTPTTTAAAYTAVTADATATATAPAEATSSAPTFATTNNSNKHGSGGLSTGATIGIAVGVPVGVLAIAGGILAAYCLGRKKHGPSATNVSHVEQQGAIGASGQRPTSFATMPVTAEKVGYVAAVTEVNSAQFQSVIPDEKLGVPQQSYYAPQQTAAAVAGVSPASPYQDAASPVAYAPPQPQPNAYGVPSNMAPPQQSTISQAYGAPAASPPYAPTGIATTGSPPPTNAMYNVPTDTPGATGAAELPAGQP